MPLVYKGEDIDYQIGLWKIEEEIPFFESAFSYRSNAVHPERIKQQLAARMALYTVDNAFPFHEVMILDGGKPVLRQPTSRFSLSHCKGFGAAIISKSKEVGVDIEPVSDRVLKIEKKFMNSHEFKLLDSFSYQDRILYATLFWSLKETMFKWWGKGGVDFSDHIQIQSFELKEKGSAQIKFSTLPEEDFRLQYFLHDQIWVTSVCK